LSKKRNGPREGTDLLTESHNRLGESEVELFVEQIVSGLTGLAKEIRQSRIARAITSTAGEIHNLKKHVDFVEEESDIDPRLSSVALKLFEKFLYQYEFEGPGIPKELTVRSVVDRLHQIDVFARSNPGKPVSQLVCVLFPDIAKSENLPLETESPPLPKKAPERWPSDPAKRKENPVQFATRVYRVWMDASVLTRQALKDLDPLLFASVDSWLKNNRRKPKPEPLPDGFKLLTVAQANDAWIEKVESGPVPDDPAELARLAAAKRRRVEKSDKSR
jgi:hypothetical protein